jgi:hypothetical protein
MSWGATAFTPIVTYNQPPFGFHEVITPTDYKRCNEDPYIGTEQLKEELNQRFRLLEKLRQQRQQREMAEICANPTKGFEGFGCFGGDGMLWKLVVLVSIAYMLVKLLKK